ncbi:hypothetical protein HU200_057011 [Digitaria exilis]|uniref:Uncharacterized protein n=1 Tax=Digitaria exilis TaxID=1010633 RepID=A0A835AFY8_9POAL|nr:hypothetical protein HU200_057011 [Digitaria exilis]
MHPWQEKTESMQQLQEDDEVAMVVHERILKQVKMDDYGRYDPSPTMAKPHFKDIPNYGLQNARATE